MILIDTDVKFKQITSMDFILKCIQLLKSNAFVKKVLFQLFSVSILKSNPQCLKFHIVRFTVKI